MSQIFQKTQFIIIQCEKNKSMMQEVCKEEIRYDVSDLLLCLCLSCHGGGSFLRILYHSRQSPWLKIYKKLFKNTLWQDSKLKILNWSQNLEFMRENSNILLSYSFIFSAKIQISDLASFHQKSNWNFTSLCFNKQIHVVHNRRNSIKKIKSLKCKIRFAF